MNDELAQSKAVALIKAPIEKIDLGQWLFTLTDAEYQLCSPAHIAAGSNVSADGKRMSINVEKIADNFLVQHYVEEISTPSLCRVYSLSDSFSGFGHTKLGIRWEVGLTRVSENLTELTNTVVVFMTDDFASSLKAAGISDLKEIKAGMLENLVAHNREETPLFAKDIERKALRGVWD